MRAFSLAVCVALGACAEAGTETSGVDLPSPREGADAGFLSWDVVSDDAAAKSDDAGADASARPDLPASTDLGAAATDAPAPPPRDAPAAARCGDGVIDPGEVCDDGNTAGGDVCAGDCRSVACAFARAWVDPATSRCYWRDTAVVRRPEAVARCESQGASLAAFESPGERAAVYPNMGLGGSNRVWVALQRRDGMWQWDNGGPMGYMGFRSGEPSGDGDCVEWGPADSFNDLGCSNSRDFVCERAPPGRVR